MAGSCSSASSSNNPEPWADWKSEVEDVLTKLKDVEGSFAVGGQLVAAPYVAVSIEGAGCVTFPLFEDKGAIVVKFFDQAPYGRKSETIVDTSVRNTWQLSPSAFKITNPRWEFYMQETVLPLVAKGLGIHTPVKSTLYKLLLYETGSFFKLHRDSEKEDRMFGTLVIQLPSKCDGGQLVVKHGMEKETFNFSASDPELGNEFCMFYSAFYCDCEHEVLPVTSGYRMSLVYNLCSRGSDSIPIAPTLYNSKEKLLDLLITWPTEKIQKIVCVLAHQYTKAGLSFKDLKGCDKIIVQVFTEALEACPLILHLCLVSKHETGGGDCDEYTGELDYIHEDTMEPEYLLHNWIAPDNTKKPFGEFSVDEESELIPEDCFQNAKPDEQDFTERTGNEGATVERWYHRAAVVVWPQASWEMTDPASKVPSRIVFDTFIDFISEHHSKMVEHLESDFVSCFEFNLKQFRDFDGSDRLVDHGECVKLKEDKAMAALSFVVGLDNLAVLQRYLELYCYGNSSVVSLLIEQCDKFGWKCLYPQLIIVLEREKNSVEILLLLMDCEKLDGERREVCHKLFKKILAGKKSSFSWSPFWQRGIDAGAVKNERVFFEKIFAACSIGDFDLAKFLNAKAAKYRVQVVIPVLISLLEKSASVASDPVWRKLVNFCLIDLENIVTVKVEEPTSWRRSTDISCSNSDCSCLKSFLVMDRDTTTLNVAKSRRRHIEAHLENLKGITFETKWNGNRHNIVVQKNKSEFEKKLKEYNDAKAVVDILKPAVADGANSAVNQPTKKAKLDKLGTEEGKCEDQ